MSTEFVAKNSSMLLFIAYCLIIEIFIMRCEFNLKMINWFNCWIIQWLFFFDQLLQNQHVAETSSIQCNLIDFLLIHRTWIFYRFFDLKLYCIQIVKNSFCIKVSTSCANFFNCFDIFDLSLLLRIIENLKRLTFVVENVNEIKWLKSRM